MNIVEREIARISAECAANVLAIQQNEDLINRYQSVANAYGLDVVVAAVGGMVDCTLIGHFFNGGADVVIANNPAAWVHTWATGRHVYDVTIGSHVYRIAEDMQ